MKFICINNSPRFVFTIGKTYEVFDNIYLNHLWVLDDFGNYRSLTQNGAHFIPIEEHRNKKLEELGI